MNMTDRKRIRVHCCAGHHGEETPRRFFLDDQAIEVAAIIDRWIAPDHRYFKCRAGDSNVYILRHDVERDCWELTMFSRGSAPHEWGEANPSSRH